MKDKKPLTKRELVQLRLYYNAILKEERTELMQKKVEEYEKKQK